jgi:hypothetical protein
MLHIAIAYNVYHLYIDNSLFYTGPVATPRAIPLAKATVFVATARGAAVQKHQTPTTAGPAGPHANPRRPVKPQ